MAQIFRVLVQVNEIDEAESFYSTLLGVNGKRVSPGRHYFDCEGVILACFDPMADGDGYSAQPNLEPIYFAVDRLSTYLNRAKKLDCQSLDAEPEVQPWGEKSFYLKDPFGNPLCFVQKNTALKL